MIVPFALLLQKALKYAEKSVGRTRAYRVFMGLATPDPGGVVTARMPLAERWGFKRLVINEAAVIAAAREHMGAEARGLAAPPYDIIHDYYMKEVKRVAAAHNIDPALITPDTVMGKNDQVVVMLPTSRRFALGDAMWRLIDWLRAIVGSGWSAPLERFTLLNEENDKEALGDGVVGVVTGASLGLPADLVDFFQCRLIVEDATKVIHTLGKGIIIVHPAAKNVLAWQDFYGEKRPQGTLIVYDMATGSKRNYKSRYIQQGLLSQGVPKWWRAVFQLDNFRLSDEDSPTREQKLISANAPLSALGGYGLIAVFTRLMRSSVTSGRSRMLLPGKAFRFITGLEHVAEIEETLAEGDQEYGVPYYYAPEKEQRYYEAYRVDGRVRRILDRRPNVSTGQNTRRFELRGYLPFNALVVPSWGLKLAAADFDGDTGVDFPVPEQGGLYLGFNDLSADERARRLRPATSDRKQVTLEDGTVVAATKRLYESPSHRHCGQLEAKYVLGDADLNSRYLLDMAAMLEAEGRFEEAQAHRDVSYVLQAWVQAAVDRQKRPVPWPHPKGPRHMPRAPEVEGRVYLTALLRKVTKGTDEDYGESETYAKSWDAFMSKRWALAELANPQALSIVMGNPEMVQAAHRWAHELSSRFSEIEAEVPLLERTGRPAPHAVNFPDLETARSYDPDELHADLRQSLMALDEHWTDLVRVEGDVRKGVFNLLNGLIDAANELGVAASLAEHCRTYSLFFEFASVEQLADYFAPLEGKRLSDVFMVVDGPDIVRVTNNTWTNVQPFHLGFTYVPQGELRLVTTPRRTIYARVNELLHEEITACTVNDALLVLQGRLWERLEPLVYEHGLDSDDPAAALLAMLANAGVGASSASSAPPKGEKAYEALSASFGDALRRALGGAHND
jgi:hypothetical protein